MIDIKAGRPKDPTKAKNRRYTLVLNEAANDVFLKESRKRGNTQRWLHGFVSREIIKKFSDPSDRLKQKMFEKTEARNKLDKEIGEIRDRLKEEDGGWKDEK